MTAKAFKKKVPYLDTEDTLEEVGISRRQLNYWREKELFKPELGEDSKKFTEKDIKLLSFARRLIVEQQFPVEVAKRLINAATTDEMSWMGLDFEDFQYLDIKSGTLLSKGSVESKLWGEFGATAPESTIEHRLYDLVLLLFRLVRNNRRSPAAYQERRDEVFRQLQSWEMASRLACTAESISSMSQVELDPILDYAPHLFQEPTNLDDADQWLVKANERLKEYEDAVVALYGPRGVVQARFQGRFYSAQDVAHASRNSSLDNYEEVPF